MQKTVRKEKNSEREGQIGEGCLGRGERKRRNAIKQVVVDPPAFNCQVLGVGAVLPSLAEFNTLKGKYINH